MKTDWKSLIRVAAAAFVLYLLVFYWEGISDVALLVLGAAVPLFLGGIFAYIVNIPMSFLERHYFPKSKSRLASASRRPVCMILAYIGIAAAVVFMVYMILPELANSVQLLTKEIPSIIDRIYESLRSNEFLSGFITEEYVMELINGIDLQSVLENLFQILGGLGGSVGSVFSVVGTAFSTVTSFLLSFIISIYILISKEKLATQFSRLMNTYLKASWNGKINYVAAGLNDNFHKFIVGQCAEALILGVLCGLCMSLLRFPYALTIGVLIGFMALIPYVGAFIGAAVGAFMILTVSFTQMWMFLIFIVVLQQLENNLIYPRVIGTSIGLPALWILCAITVGGALMGIWGMLISVPITATVYQLVKADADRRKGRQGKG